MMNANSWPTAAFALVMVLIVQASAQEPPTSPGRPTGPEPAFEKVIRILRASGTKDASLESAIRGIFTESQSVLHGVIGSLARYHGPSRRVIALLETGTWPEQPPSFFSDESTDPWLRSKNTLKSYPI